MKVWIVTYWEDHESMAVERVFLDEGLANEYAEAFRGEVEEHEVCESVEALKHPGGMVAYRASVHRQRDDMRVYVDGDPSCAPEERWRVHDATFLKAVILAKNKEEATDKAMDLAIRLDEEGKWVSGARSTDTDERIREIARQNAARRAKVFHSIAATSSVGQASTILPSNPEGTAKLQEGE